jgi:hypothetical protein
MSRQNSSGGPSWITVTLVVAFAIFFAIMVFTQ